MEKERKEAIEAAIVVLMILFVLLAVVCFAFQGWMQNEQEQMSIVHEKNGTVEVVILIPDGIGQIDSTLIVFDDNDRIKIQGFHPEIERGQIWSFKYTNSSSFRSVKILKEKQLLQDNA